MRVLFIMSLAYLSDPRPVYKPRRPKKTFSIAYLNTSIVNAYLDTTIWVWKEIPSITLAAVSMAVAL
jgi:hypothetical protein